MENLLTSLSFWGIAAIVATTFQLFWESVRTESKLPLIDVASLTQHSTSLFSTHHKSFVILLFCLTGLWALHYWALPNAQTITYALALAGATSYGLAYGISHWLKAYAHRIFSLPSRAFANSHPFHLTHLLLGVSCLLLMLLGYQSQLAWTPYLIINVFGAYLLGSSCVHLILQLIGSFKDDQSSALAAQPSFLLSIDRLDALTGAAFATALLGGLFVNSQAFSSQFHGLGGILLPLVLPLTGTILSGLSLFIAKMLPKLKVQQVLFAEKLVTTLWMIIASFCWVRLLLPTTWVSGTREYRAIEVFYAAQSGLICGLIISKLIQLYEKVEKIFLEYLYLKAYRVSVLDRLILNGVRVFSTMLPLLLLITAFLLAYQWVGLYGVCVAVLAMQSNLRTELSAEVAELEKLILRSKKLFFPAH